MDPNDLLIFKERKTTVSKEGAEAQKAQEEPAQKAQAKAKSDALEELRTKIARHEEAARKEKEEKAARKAAAKETAHKETKERGETRRVEPTFEPKPPKQRKETKSEVMARESAVGLSCVWHPWRPSYAICNYCHRAFCFEDIVTERGNYYCLEDMDTAIRAKIEAASSKSSNAGIISGGAFLIPVLIFIYTYNTVLANAVSYVVSIGFIPFIYNPIYQYAFPIMGAAATMLSFILGLWLFLGNRNVFPGLAVGSLTSAMFLYNYLQSNNIYDLVIGLTSLAALMLFAYSRSVYVPLAEEVVVPMEEEIAPQWTNAGRF